MHREEEEVKCKPVYWIQWEANLVQNVKSESKNLRSVSVTVVLYCLKKKGNCKQFIANRVKKIRGKNLSIGVMNWCYKNPAEIRNRRSIIVNVLRV